MRVVWLDGALVDPARAALSIDDPGVRWGEGLFETMRAEGGRVALLERHLSRLLRSAATLGLAPFPGAQAMREAVREALDAAPPGPCRVRLSATPRPTLLVEVTGEPALSGEVPLASGVALAGTWWPSNRLAEHKTFSYAAHRHNQRRAEAAGADHALLLDDRGRLGEAALASVFCVVAGEVLTAPAQGLLGGVGRALVMEAMPVREEAAEEAGWRSASEIVLTNSVRGALALVALDGAPVGDGAAGPLARRIHRVLTDALTGGQPIGAVAP